MRGGRQTKTLTLKEQIQPSKSPNCSTTARNLNKKDLAGVIFGCKYRTIDECYSKELFGLPARHISYVRKIDPGLPLFLFNYSDRTLHGIFEAASKGSLNINSSAWNADGSDSTPYAAQVMFRIRMGCKPLLEDQFRPLISENYYERDLFWFELDQKQTNNLISLFSCSRLPRPEFTFSPVEGNKNTSVQLDRGYSESGASSSQNISGINGEKNFLNPIDDIMAAKVLHENPVLKKRWTSLFIASAPSEAGKKAEDFKTPHSELSLASKSHSNMECKSSDLLASSDLQSELIDPLKNLLVNCSEQLATLNPSNEVSSSSAEAPIRGEDEVFEKKALDINTPFSDKSNTPESSSCDLHLTEESQDFNVPANIETIEFKGATCKTVTSCEFPSISDSREELALEDDHGQSIPFQWRGSDDKFFPGNVMDFDMKSYSPQFSVAELLEVVKNLILNQQKQAQSISGLEQDQVQTRNEIQLLRERCSMLEGHTYPENSEAGKALESKNRSHLYLDSSLLIVGGYNSITWLPTLDRYHHSTDRLEPVTSMKSAQFYASAAKLNDEVYIFGGICDNSWHYTVESYNLGSHQWVSRPPLDQWRKNLAGITFNSKLFAIGGANEFKFLSEVEMLDLDVGKWIPIQPMIHTRFDLAAAEIDGVLYAVGGCDGKDYVKSVERLDPREFSWRRVEDMSAKRGSLSVAVLNKKLYALGGYDGYRTTSTVEVFDPRKGSWMMAESMHDSRGYFSSVVIGDTIFAIGGISGNEILDKVECYKEGRGWELTNLESCWKKMLFFCHCHVSRRN